MKNFRFLFLYLFSLSSALCASENIQITFELLAEKNAALEYEHLHQINAYEQNITQIMSIDPHIPVYKKCASELLNYYKIKQKCENTFNPLRYNVNLTKLVEAADALVQCSHALLVKEMGKLHNLRNRLPENKKKKITSDYVRIE